MIKGNKGEWSELYVLFKLLGDKKIHAGDGQLNKLKEYYPVLLVIRDELRRHLEYSIQSDIVIVTEDGQEIARIPTCEFLFESSQLYLQIHDNKDKKGAFAIPAIDNFLKKIHCEVIKAKSVDKSDIHVVVHDYRTGMTPNLGFSIKSHAGQNPTLLNASQSTRFTFEIMGEPLTQEEIDAINAIATSRKMMARVQAIHHGGRRLEYRQMSCPIFQGNLEMIDSQLPNIVAWMLCHVYELGISNVVQMVEHITLANPFGYNLTEKHDMYGHKMKQLLEATALGMTPTKVWSGDFDATGGYIVVKEDGEMLCFHIYNRNTLKDYLLHSTKFETASTSRNQFGSIYQREGHQYFDIALQVRFTQ